MRKTTGNTNGNPNTTATPALTVFGTRPVDAIYLPDIPFSVRLNCKSGGIFIGGSEDHYRRSKSNETFEINIIKASKYFGSLGQTKNVLWIQLFFVPAPSVPAEILPKNTVCVAYIKKQSVARLFHTVQDAMNQGEPAEGIFTVSFQKEVGKEGTYYSIAFDWRERQTDEEKAQLQQIANFLKAQGNQLIDLDGTREMVCVDGWSAEQINALLVESHSSLGITTNQNNNQPRLSAGQ